MHFTDWIDRKNHTLNLLKPVLIILLFLLNENLTAQQLTFPGAEGNGQYTIGGRGGVVYEVTNLNDSGPGSLREAVDARGARTVVFRVSGTIRLQSDLKIKYSNITIAGQTAPGDGICLADNTLFVNGDQVIIRYLRFRLGDESGQEDDATWGRYCKNVIIDHCSASWSVDEAFSYYGIDSLTVQWCLISESLYLSHHSKGAHGYGGIWGGTNATFHHNLLAHHSSRNPRFSGGETPPCVNVDFRNNVIYNWGFNSAYGGEAGQINMVANYYKAGPATKSSVRNRIVQPGSGGKWYIGDNFVEGYPEITENNWNGGVQGSYGFEEASRVYEPLPYIPITEHTAEEAYEAVLEHAGANLPVRDAVDERILNEVRIGAATYDGTGYERIQGFSDTSVVRGIIDSQSQVGGWPLLESTEPPVDSDHDGMPDEWELTNGLNPDDDTDRNVVDASGYTMLENYLNSLVPFDPTSVVNEDAPISAKFTLLQNYPNPFNPTTTITLSIPNAGVVDLKIYDIRGRLVSQLLNQALPAGMHPIEWNGRNVQGQHVASGIYFSVLRFNHKQEVIKMQLIR